MLKKDVQFYEMEIRAITQELHELPEGHLNKKGSYYCETIGTTQKGITKDKQRIRQLARKAYLLRKLRHLEWNNSLTKKFLQRYKTEDSIEIIRGLPSFYQTLPVNYFFHPSVHDQTEKAAEVNLGYMDGLVYLTSSGIRVRSKSERIIADVLDKNEIPYRYEAALSLGGVNRYPDFTIYRPFDEKMFLWEHLGLMDQDKYQLKTTEKLSLYARYGFFPFDNLICTYEEDLMNPGYIHAIIEMFILR